MSDVEQTAVDGAQVAPEQPTAQEQQAPVQAQESTTEQVGTPEQAEKPRDEKGRFVPQERVNEITRARREAERRAEALERELATYRQQPAQHQPQQRESPPSINDFSDSDSWARAVTEYAVRQASASADQRFHEQDQRRSQQQVVEQFEARSKAYAAEHPGFDDRLADLASSVQFSPYVVEAIGLSEHGPAVADYLASHLDEADRISRLAPHIAALHLGRIEAQVSAPKPKPVTNAPNPPPALGGGSVAKKDLAKLSYAEYRKQRMGS